MMLHAALPTMPELPMPLHFGRSAHESAGGGGAIPATQPFTLPASLPLETVPDEGAVPSEPEDDGPADTGLLAADLKVAAADATPALQAPAILPVSSNSPVASAAAGAAPPPAPEADAGELWPTIQAVDAAHIDTDLEPDQPDSRTSKVEDGERLAEGEAHDASPADSPIIPPSGPAPLSHAPHPAEAPLAYPVAPQFAVPVSPASPAARPASLAGSVARPTPGVPAAVSPVSGVNAEAGPTTRLIVSTEPGEQGAAGAIRAALASSARPATRRDPIAMGGARPMDAHVVSAQLAIEPDAAAAALPRAMAGQEPEATAGAVPVSIPADAEAPASPSPPEAIARGVARRARAEVSGPSLVPPGDNGSTPPTDLQQAGPKRPAVEASPARTPAAVAPQPQPIPAPVPADSDAVAAVAAVQGGVTAPRTGPAESGAASLRGSAGAADGDAPLAPHPGDTAEAAPPVETVADASVAPAPAPSVPPSPRLVAEAALQPSAPPLEPGSDAAWTERLSLDLGALIEGPVRQLRFKLRPATLGEMAISVETERGQLRVALIVESREAHAIVTRDLDQLRTAAQQQGLRLDHATVELAAPAFPSSPEAGMGGASGGWAGHHRHPPPVPGDGPAVAADRDANAGPTPRPWRVMTGGRIDVYA